jgi:hypothetical protein
LMAKANTDSAKIDFRLDFLLGITDLLAIAESGCLSAVSVRRCASNVLVICIDLK